MKTIQQELQVKKSELNTRRLFLKTAGLSLGAMALGAFQNPLSAANHILKHPGPLATKQPHFPAKAKAVIYLHMAGAPSQLELFDYKPELQKLHGQRCPTSFMEGKQFAFIRGIPKMLGPQATFKQHGASRAWISERLPHLATVADELSFLKAVHTDQFNHAPAQLLMHTGLSLIHI